MLGPFADIKPLTKSLENIGFYLNSSPHVLGLYWPNLETIDHHSCSVVIVDVPLFGKSQY